MNDDKIAHIRVVCRECGELYHDTKDMVNGTISPSLEASQVINDHESNHPDHDKLPYHHNPIVKHPFYDSFNDPRVVSMQCWRCY